MGIRILVNSSSVVCSGGGANKCSRVCVIDGGGKKANASAYNSCCSAIAAATIMRIIDNMDVLKEIEMAVYLCANRAKIYRSMLVLLSSHSHNSLIVSCRH